VKQPSTKRKGRAVSEYFQEIDFSEDTPCKCVNPECNWNGTLRDTDMTTDPHDGTVNVCVCPVCGAGITEAAELARQQAADAGEGE
jgi:hypothetical protein